MPEPARLPPGDAFLEHYPAPGGASQRIALEPLPFRLGRAATAHFVLQAPQVSKEHAEVYQGGDRYCIRDLRSTNGTFVNGQRIEEALLANGDIVHIAHQEFRFASDAADDTAVAEPPITELARSGLPASLIRGNEHLRELLRTECVRAVFQPIVELDTAKTIAYEALGRGTHRDLSAHPGPLFELAERCGLAPELSQLFRAAALREAARLPPESLIFLNLHPAELAPPDFLGGLDALTRQRPGAGRLVLEIHENTQAEPAVLSRLRAELRDRHIRIAYDDFGAGQSRLAELADVPPDFIKLDMRLVRGIHQDGGRQSLVQAVNQVTREFGIRVIAEGIETPDEAAVCRRLGCHLGQGYLFGKPDMAAAFERREARDTHLYDLSQLRERLGPPRV